jgi:hypothetical protein
MKRKASSELGFFMTFAISWYERANLFCYCFFFHVGESFISDTFGVSKNDQKAGHNPQNSSSRLRCESQMILLIQRVAPVPIWIQIPVCFFSTSPSPWPPKHVSFFPDAGRDAHKHISRLLSAKVWLMARQQRHKHTHGQKPATHPCAPAFSIALFGPCSLLRCWYACAAQMLSDRRALARLSLAACIMWGTYTQSQSPTGKLLLCPLPVER